MREMVVLWARVLRFRGGCVGGRSMAVEMVGGERRVVVQPRLGGRVDVRLGVSEEEAELREVVREVSRAVRVAWVSFLESREGGVLVKYFMRVRGGGIK